MYYLEVLFNLQISLEFPAIVLLLVSILIPLWSENIRYIASILLCLLGVFYRSGPQLFWHQGPVLWKTIFPRTRRRGGFRQ